MSTDPVMRSLLSPQSRPTLVCSDVSHLRSGFATWVAESPFVIVPPNGYRPPGSVFSSSCVAYGASDWLPCRPHPARSARVENRLPLMNDSLLMRHEPEMAGNVDHLCPSASRDEPSRRTTAV